MIHTCVLCSLSFDKTPFSDYFALFSVFKNQPTFSFILDIQQVFHFKREVMITCLLCFCHITILHCRQLCPVSMLDLRFRWPAVLSSVQSLPSLQVIDWFTPCVFIYVCTSSKSWLWFSWSCLWLDHHQDLENASLLSTATLNHRVTVQVQRSEVTVHPHTIFTMTEGRLFVVGKRKNRIKEERKRCITDFYKFKSYLLTLKVKTVQILIIFRN